MKTFDRHSPGDEELRKRAEELLRGDVVAADTSLAEVDVMTMLHELQVHQVELELQNEELLQNQAEATAVLERYRELYDYAPVGYFSFEPDGSIQKVNLTGAAMLMVERSRLIDRRFPLFLTNETRGTFTDFLKRVFQTTIRQVCEVVLQPEGGCPVFIRIEAESSGGGQFCLAAATDITELKAKTTELEQLIKSFVGRELRMVELKERIRELEEKAPPSKDNQ